MAKAKITKHTPVDGDFYLITNESKKLLAKAYDQATADLIACAEDTKAALIDLADVAEAYLVHGDVDLAAWIKKARKQAGVL